MRQRRSARPVLVAVTAVVQVSFLGCANSTAGPPPTGASADPASATSTDRVDPAAPSTSTSTTSPPAQPGSVEVSPEADLYGDPPDVNGRRVGDLVRYQRIAAAPRLDGTVTPGDLWRVMYVSTDDVGTPIVVTGTVRVPSDRPRPAAGWPVVTWAHGTSGSADRCAPSKQQDYPPAPDPVVSDGFVIASTDYAGLGTPGLHPYFDGGSEGRSLLDIVPPRQRASLASTCRGSSPSGATPRAGTPHCSAASSRPIAFRASTSWARSRSHRPA